MPFVIILGVLAGRQSGRLDPDKPDMPAVFQDDQVGGDYLDNEDFFRFLEKLNRSSLLSFANAGTVSSKIINNKRIAIAPSYYECFKASILTI